MDLDILKIHREQILPSISAEIANELFHDTSIICKGGDCIRASSVFLSGLSAWLAVLLKSTHAEEFSILLPEVDSSTMRDIISLACRNLSAKAPLLSSEEKLSSLNGVLWSRVEVDENLMDKDDVFLENDALLEVKHEMDAMDVHDHSEDEIHSDGSEYDQPPLTSDTFDINFDLDHEVFGKGRRSNRIESTKPNYVVDNDDSTDEFFEKKCTSKVVRKKRVKKELKDEDFKVEAEHANFLDEHDLSDPGERFTTVNYGQKERCPICEQQFILGKRTVNGFKKHLRRHKINHYQCDCGVPLDTFDERAEHIKLVHWKWKRCEFCVKILELHQLKQHYKVHKRNDEDIKEVLDLRMPECYRRKKMGKLLCQDCGQSFVTKKEKEEYAKHMEKHMVDNFTCNCNIDVSKMPFGEKMQHIKVVHENKGYLACPDCTLYTKSKETLERHRLDVHNMSHTCDICGYVTKNKYCLKDHYDRLHAALDHECDICKVKLTKLQHKDHMKKKHSEEKCPQCGTTVKNLKKHIKTMHVPDEEKEFRCPQCPRGFVSKKYLNVHIMNVHTKSRPYKCRYGCEFAYNDSSNRNHHEKKKHGGLFKDR